MSNHFSGPDFTFPQSDSRLDISDLYAFPKPGEPRKSILIMNVHPSIGLNPPGPTPDDGFADEARYEFRIDNDGDARPDVVYRVQFSTRACGGQTASVYRLEGPDVGDDVTPEQLIGDAPVSDLSTVRVIGAGDYQFYAGPRSDPFFADVAGAINSLNFSGADSMAGIDVYAIVLEVPNEALGPASRLGLWATVRVRRQSPGGNQGWFQIDRAGRPETVNLYCQGEDKAVFNAASPADDRTAFVDRFAHALEHMGEYPRAAATAMAMKLLPDILPYDYTLPAALPESGRTLTDDAFDQALSVYLRRPISDGVGPHSDLLADFPYLGPPHRARTASH
jgi:hypothetical protein